MKTEPEVTRFEVITSSGREMTRYFAPGTLRYDYQDDGRTLKVFLMEPNIPGWTYNGKGFNTSDLRVLAKFEELHFAYYSSPMLFEIEVAIKTLIERGLPFSKEEV